MTFHVDGDLSHLVFAGIESRRDMSWVNDGSAGILFGLVEDDELVNDGMAFLELEDIEIFHTSRSQRQLHIANESDFRLFTKGGRSSLRKSLTKLNKAT